MAPEQPRQGALRYVPLHDFGQLIAPKSDVGGLALDLALVLHAASLFKSEISNLKSSTNAHFPNSVGARYF